MGKGHPKHNRIIGSEEILRLWGIPKTAHHSLSDLADLSKMEDVPSDQNLRRREPLDADGFEFSLVIRVDKKETKDASVLLMLHEDGDNRILARFDTTGGHEASTKNEYYSMWGPHIHILVEQDQGKQGDDWYAFGFPATDLKLALLFAAYFFNITYNPEDGVAEDEGRGCEKGDRCVRKDPEVGQP